MNTSNTNRVLSAPLPENAALIDEFIAQAEVSERTRVKYRPHLLEFERWYRQAAGSAGTGMLIDVRTGDVSRFMAYLRSGDRFARSGNHRAVAAPAASTRKNILASLGSFYRYLTAVEVVTASPVSGVAAPKVNSKPGLCLTADDVRALLAVRGQPRERVQVFLLTFTGAREHEIRTLRWQDVDLQNQTLIVRGKGDKYRVIDIHPRLMSELRRWYLHQEDLAERNEAIRVAKSNPETDYVLMTRLGKPLSHSTIIKQLKRRAAKAGLYLHERPDGENVSAVHPHALRRTFGTLLLNDGHHLDAVADVLGHASVDTTRKHYAFSSNERRRETIHGFKV